MKKITVAVFVMFLAGCVYNSKLHLVATNSENQRSLTVDIKVRTNLFKKLAISIEQLRRILEKEGKTE